MLDRLLSPTLFSMGLCYDIDNPAGGGGQETVTEEVTETPVVDTGQVEETTEAPFHSYKHDDGEEHVFKTPDELNDYIRQGTLRHSDYTRKTQEAAEQKKALEAERQKFDAEYTEFLNKKSEYDKIDQFVKSLPPDEYEKLKNGLKDKQQRSGDPRVDQLMQQMEEEKKAREEREQAEEESRMREAAFSQLSQRFPDFKKDNVMGLVKELEEVAPGDGMYKMLEMLYYASKGKTSPAQLEEEISNNLQRKQTSRPPLTGGGSPAGVKAVGGFNSLEEAAEAAKQEFRE